MTEETTTFERTPPSDTLDVRVDEKMTTIFMSFGLRRALVTALGGMENIDRMMVDPDTGDRLMEAVLQERNKAGKVISPRSLDDFAISVDDADKLLTWVGDHLFDFFMKRLESTKAVGEKFGPMLLALMDSTTGSEGSPSSMESAGRSRKSRAK